MNNPASRPRVTAPVLAAIPLAVHAFLAWKLRAAAISTGQDDAVYALLGRGLRDFAYHNYWLVPNAPHGTYPPLYPLVLGVTTGIFGDGMTPALVLSVVFSTLALGILFSIAYRWSPPVAFLTLSVSAVNPWLVRMAGQMYTEPLYLLCTALTLWFLAAPVASSRSRFGAGSLAIASFLVRVMGITMIAAVFLTWVVERRRRAAFVFALVGVLCVGGWFVRARIAAGAAMAGQSYIADALSTRFRATPERDTVARGGRDSSPAPGVTAPTSATPPSGLVTSIPAFVSTVVKRIIYNTPAYLSRRVPSVLAFPTIPGTTVDNWLWLVLLVLLGGIGLFELSRRLPGAALYLGCFGGALLVWPYSLPRFLVPVIPLLLLVLFLGLGRLVKRRSGALAGTLLSLLALVLVASGFSQVRRELAAMARCDRSAPYTSEGCFDQVERGFFEAVRQADREAPAGAVFMSPKMATVYFLTGRRSIDELRATRLGPEELRQHLKDFGVQYILFSRIHLDQKWLAERLQSSCGEWEVRAEYAGGALLLRRAEDQPPEPARATCEALSRFARGPW
jgi:hypothetical protein